MITSLLDFCQIPISNLVVLFESLCMFCFWLRLLAFSRGLKQMSPMIRLFMVLFLLATFYLLQVQSSQTEINEKTQTFRAFYQSSVGNTENIVALKLI